MSGPFSKAEVHYIIGGHFVVCPLGLVEKAGDPGKFRVVRDLSYHQKEDGYSVNQHLDASLFPTEWGTAAQVADIVSLLPLHALFIAPSHSIFTLHIHICMFCIHRYRPSVHFTLFFTPHLLRSPSQIQIVALSTLLTPLHNLQSFYVLPIHSALHHSCANLH